MKIHCYSSIPLEEDEPVPAIRQFVAVLRKCAVNTEKAELDVNLIGSSKRARTTVQEFQPERAKGAGFERALAITEELTQLGAAKIKSLSFMLSAQGFRWKGSREGTEARFALLDAKVFQRKSRFDLSAHLLFEAADAKEAFIETMLAEIAKATGIRFELQASQMQLEANEPGRATPEELFVTSLVWNEIVEKISKKVQQEISLAGSPHLMSTPEAHQFLFDPEKFGKSVRVDFARIVRKWLKEEFPDYTRIANALDGEVLYKPIGPEIQVSFSVEKKPKAFSKEFTIGLAADLTAPRFAPTPDRPFHLSLNLFRLFGVGPLPMQWTYFTEKDLEGALAGAAKLLRQVLAVFEPEAAQMQHAHKRRVEDFAGPREVSAREAAALALPLAKEWAQDAALIRITSNAITAWYFSSFSALLRTLNGAGRLAMNGGWWLQFHSRKKGENLYVTVPCRGPITQTRMDASAGRQWPSDFDQILREGWVDSPEAQRIAREAGEAKGVSSASESIQLFELSSRANRKAAGVIRPPFRDGMFPMEAAWRISFSQSNEKERKIAMVTVPAYGGGAPVVEVHAYDKHGRPMAG